MQVLVQYQERKLADTGLKDLEAALAEHIEETPNGVTEVRTTPLPE